VSDYSCVTKNQKLFDNFGLPRHLLDLPWADVGKEAAAVDRKCPDFGHPNKIRSYTNILDISFIQNMGHQPANICLQNQILYSTVARTVLCYAYAFFRSYVLSLTPVI